ncbi:MAG: hypothetical protein WB646_10085 [Steroidobacteraceae bacterium]
MITAVQSSSLWREIFAMGREKNWLHHETAVGRVDPLKGGV